MLYDDYFHVVSVVFHTINDLKMMLTTYTSNVCKTYRDLAPKDLGTPGGPQIVAMETKGGVCFSASLVTTQVKLHSAPSLPISALHSTVIGLCFWSCLFINVHI